MRYMFDRNESFNRNEFIETIISNDSRANPETINRILNKIIAGETFKEGSPELKIKDYYEANKQYFMDVKYTTPSSVRHRNNNQVISIQYAILTHKNSMELIFTPGNFDVPKKLGYLMAVLKGLRNSEASPEEVNMREVYLDMSKKSISKLKDMSIKDKNLIYSSVHVQFHKQNMTAGKLIGVFATGNVSHAFMSLLDCYISVPEEYGFVLNGKSILGNTRIDPIYDESGNRVSSNLASFLAASVDAVKDPVLNLVNININTVNILMTLSRLGFDTETICLLLSLPIVDKLLVKLTLDDQNNYIGDIILGMKKSLLEDLKIEVQSNFNYTKEFFIENLITDNEVNDLYILDLLEKVLSLSNTFKNITHMTKYNSITSAVGPFASNTEARRLLMLDFYTDPMITESVIEAVNNPILKSFRDNAYTLELSLLGNNIILASPQFKMALRTLKENLGYMTEKISGEFSNFFIDYIVNMGDGVYDMSFEHRKEVIFDFPLKVLKEKLNYPDNAFMLSIKYNVSDDGHPSLSLRTRGLSSELELDIKANWAKLYKDNPKLALDILEYNVMVGTFGFNPKTFTREAPNVLKIAIPKYIERLNVRNMPSLNEDLIDNIIILFMLNKGFTPAGTHNINSYEVVSKPSETEFYIKSKDKKRKINKEGIGNIVIDNVSHTAYFEKVGTTHKVTLIDSLGGNGKAVELDPNVRFPKSIFGDVRTPNKNGDPESSGNKKDLSIKLKLLILLASLYSESELQRISQYNLLKNDIRSGFIKSMQNRYTLRVGRELSFKERAFFWNHTDSLLDIINILASSNSSEYISILGDVNITLQDLNLCS